MTQVKPFADESLSSWKMRNQRFCHVVGFHLWSYDNDFGDFDINDSSQTEEIIDLLSVASLPPDIWILKLKAHRQYCARCIAEDWAQGIPAYLRRSWRVAWRTCCPRHGLLEVLGPGRPWKSPLLDGLERPLWVAPHKIAFFRRENSKKPPRPPSCVFSFPIIGRRGIYLESALARASLATIKYRCPHDVDPALLRRLYALERTSLAAESSWWPRDVDPLMLRSLYAMVVRELVRQFRVGEDLAAPGLARGRRRGANWKDLLTYAYCSPAARFSVNVAVEAILSVWTRTPLPPTAGSQVETSRLFWKLGWGTPLGGIKRILERGLARKGLASNSPFYDNRWEWYV